MGIISKLDGLNGGEDVLPASTCSQKGRRGKRREDVKIEKARRLSFKGQRGEGESLGETETKGAVRDQGEKVG